MRYCGLSAIDKWSVIMNNNPHQNTPPKKPYKGWALKKRWPMAVLCGVALPLTIFMGVFEMYAGNYSEFRFSWEDFAPLLIFVCVSSALVLGGVLLSLRGRVFDVAMAVVLSVTLMASVQNMFLNVGINSLTGDGLGMSINPVWMVANMILWVAVMAGAVVAVLLVKKRKMLRLVSTVILVVLVGMQIPVFFSLALTTDVFKPKDMVVQVTPEDTSADTQNGLEVDTEMDTEANTEADTLGPVVDPSQPAVLTTKNLYTVGSEKNVIVFLVDRFDVRYVAEILASDPDYFEDWEDFTYYEDNITAYSRTYPAVASMLSGKLQPFTKGLTAEAYFWDAYQNSPLLNTLKDNDFSINIYTDDYYAYRDASEFVGLADNISGFKQYKVQNVGGLFVDLLKLSVYRYAPVALKPALSVSTDAFEQYVVYDTEYPMYELRDNEVYEGLVQNGLTVGESKNHFAFIHLWGIHPPYRIDADGGKSTSGTSLGATLGCLALVKQYISELKRLGLYEDATIVITGDHPDPISDDALPEQPRLTALFVKEAGKSGEPFEISKAQVSQDNLIPSLLTSAGVDGGLYQGQCYWDIPEDEDRVRNYHFVVNPTPERNYYWYAKYEIKGDGRDFSNWRVVGEYNMNGFYYR